MCATQRLRDLDLATQSAHSRAKPRGTRQQSAFRLARRRKQVVDARVKQYVTGPALDLAAAFPEHAVDTGHASDVQHRLPGLRICVDPLSITLKEPDRNHCRPLVQPVANRRLAQALPRSDHLHDIAERSQGLDRHDDATFQAPEVCARHARHLGCIGVIGIATDGRAH